MMIPRYNLVTDRRRHKERMARDPLGTYVTYLDHKRELEVVQFELGDARMELARKRRREQEAYTRREEAEDRLSSAARECRANERWCLDHDDPQAALRWRSLEGMLTMRKVADRD